MFVYRILRAFKGAHLFVELHWRPSDGIHPISTPASMKAAVFSDVGISVVFRFDKKEDHPVLPEDDQRPEAVISFIAPYVDYRIYKGRATHYPTLFL